MTVVAVAHLTATDEGREALADALAALARDAPTEPGCVEYVAGAVLGSPSRFVVVQRWEDHGALDEHYKGDAFKAFQSAAKELTAEPSEVEILDAPVVERIEED